MHNFPSTQCQHRDKAVLFICPGVLPLMPYTGELRPKGVYLHQASGAWKGRDFCWLNLSTGI